MVDTSAVVTLCLSPERRWPAGLMEAVRANGTHAPDVLDVEFLHALRGLVLGGKVAAERAPYARLTFDALPLIRMPTRPLSDRVWALRANLTAYDAYFIALAEVLDVPLITCDAKHANAPGHRARVLAFPPA